VLTDTLAHRTLEEGMARGGPVMPRTLRTMAGLAGAAALVPMLAACGDEPATPTRETPLPPLPTVTTTIAVTTTVAPVFYVVAPGDNLAGIAQRFGITVADLIAANAIADPNRIEVGQQLVVPPPPAPPTSASA
jgi:LysM repeat protein